MLMAQEAQGARKKELNGQSQVLQRFIFSRMMSASR